MACRYGDHCGYHYHISLGISNLDAHSGIMQTRYPIWSTNFSTSFLWFWSRTRKFKPRFVHPPFGLSDNQTLTLYIKLYSKTLSIVGCIGRSRHLRMAMPFNKRHLHCRRQDAMGRGRGILLLRCQLDKQIGPSQQLSQKRHTKHISHKNCYKINWNTLRNLLRKLFSSIYKFVN